MAQIEYISFTPMREAIMNGQVSWEPDRLGKAIARLPQIFWKGGKPWSEVNHWALTKAQGTVGSDISTVASVMKHLKAYASWLELTKLDWRHFPKQPAKKAVVRFRGELIRQRDQGLIEPSTATARMQAVIQFYRHASVHGFVSQESPLWNDRRVVLHFFDRTGFKQTLETSSSDLSIRNKKRPGIRLENGLRPLNPKDAERLLQFTDEQGWLELHFMLSLGVLSGARLETICTLQIRNLEDARPDEFMPGFSLVRVGPGTGVETKFDVSGDLLVPTFLIETLKGYAYSMRRLTRQAKANGKNRGRLFLTSHGNPYRLQSFSRLMTSLRREAVSHGMRFMSTFKFHQTRATFGTMLMEMALEVAEVKTAVAFVRDAMLHKDESTTLQYVRLVQTTPVKIQITQEFTRLFGGVINRDWNKFHA